MLIRRFIPLVLGPVICAGSFLLPGKARTAELVPPTRQSVDRAERAVVIPAVSRLLPENTAGLLLLNPDPKLWQSLAQFKSFPRDMTTPGPLFSGAFQGLTYHGDIAPWLGGPMGIAMVLDADRSHTYYATIAPVQDATQMPKFLDRAKRGRGTTLPVMRTYNGVSILYWEPKKFTYRDGEIPLDSMDADADISVEAAAADRAAAIKAGKAAGKAGALVIEARKNSTIRESRNSATAAAESAAVDTTAAIGVAVDEAAVRKKPTVREYGGYAIAYLPSGYVVASEKLKAVEYLIDAQTGTSKLADVPAFRRMLQDDRYPKSLISGYGNYELILQSDVMIDSPQASTVPAFLASPEYKAGVKLFGSIQDRVDGFLWIQPEGLQMQASFHLKQPLPKAIAGLFRSPNALVQRMPAVTYGMSDGSDLASFWRVAIAAIEVVPTFKKDLNNFRSFSQKSFGLDDRDIFPWMDQEYAGFAFPTRGGIFPKFESKLELGLGGMIQTSQRPAATTALKKIETALIKLSGGQMKVQSRSVNGQSLTSWEMPGFKGKNDKSTVSVAAYQWASPDTLMLFSGAESSANLLPKPWQSLDQSANFKAAIAPMPTDNMGYSYMNPPAVLALANRFGFASWFKTPAVPSDPELDVSNIVNSVFSVAGTTAIQGTQISSDGFAKLATRPMPTLTAQTFLERAQLKLGNDNDWAIANFTRSLELDPKQADAYYGRGSAKQSSRDFRGAIADFNSTLEMEPNKVDALRFRAEAKTEIYDYTGAVADATQGLGLKPDADSLGSFYEKRATGLIAQGNYSAALNDLNEANKADNVATQILNLQCAASARSARPDALKLCNDAIAAYIGDDSLLKDSALAQADPSVESEMFIPGTLSAHRCLARVQKKDAKAFQDCGKAISAEPDNPIIYEVQGQARLELGDKRGAVLSLEKALKLYQVLDDATAIDRTQAFLKKASL